MGRGLGTYLVVVDPSDPMGGAGGGCGGGSAADGTLGLSASMGRRRGARAAAGRLQSATGTKVEGE